VCESIVFTYELSYMLCLDYKFGISKYNSDSMSYQTGSLHNRKVGFMRITKNLFFQALTRKLWPKLKKSVAILKNCLWTKVYLFYFLSGLEVKAHCPKQMTDFVSWKK
jgi:hypothetical protein